MMTANPKSEYWANSGIGNAPRIRLIRLKYFYLPDLANSMEYAKKVEGKRTGYIVNGVCTTYVIELINKGNHWYISPQNLGTWHPNQYPFQYDITIQPPSK